MQVLWQLNGGFTKDVLDLLPEPKPPYTTLASTIRNLERKGYLRSEKLGNSYRFAPQITAEEYRQQFMSAFVSEYFKNSYKEVVSFFAKDEKISAADLQEIIRMIENRPTED